MAKYRVETEDGVFEIETDDTTSSQPEKKGLMGKAWDALAVPEKMSRSGLTQMTDAITPSRADIESGKVGIPGIAARTAGETLAEVAPSFISRGSMLTGGALKAAQIGAPAINALGRFVGRTAESTSGLGYRTPGVLSEAVKDPTLIFGKGIEKARQGYKAIQNSAQISPDLKEVSNQRAFVVRALKMAKDNNLTPDEALEARKTLDSISDSVPDIYRKQTRAIFDSLAKEKFEEADKAYARAVKSEALRSFWGINKGGTPSIVKGGLTTALPVTAPFFSPMVQGGVATGVGAAKKLSAPFVRSPMLGVGLRGVAEGNRNRKSYSTPYGD